MGEIKGKTHTNESCSRKGLGSVGLQHQPYRCCFIQRVGKRCEPRTSIKKFILSGLGHDIVLSLQRYFIFERTLMVQQEEI